MTQSHFDLQTVTRDTIATREEWTLDSLVTAVFAATPRSAVRDAYWTALRDYVRRELGNAVTDSRPGQPPHDVQTTLAGAGTTPGTPSQRPTDTQATLVGGAGPSPTRSRVGLFRAAGFRGLIHAAPGVWKSLLDCTVDDLLFAAAENDRNAERNARVAGRYRHLAKLMQERDATTPADLPADLIEEAFADDDH